MREFNVFYLYFLRVSNLTKVRGSRSDESRKAARHARHSTIARFSSRRQDSRYLTNVVEAEFAEYQKPIAPSCIEVADIRSPEQDGSPAWNYDAAKILSIRRDRQNKKKMLLRRQLTSKIVDEAARDSRIGFSRERSRVLLSIFF